MAVVKVVLRLVTEQGGTGCLALDGVQPDEWSVKDHLLDKYPPGKLTVHLAIS